jgi:exonuclease SbcD
MKAVILGDIHFGGGYSLGKVDSHHHLNSRLIDFSNTFDHVIDYMVNNEISHFVLTGDIFEHQRPQASELGVFSEKISRLSDLKIHTHIVIGNHDIVADQHSTTIDVLKNLHLPFIHVYPDIDTVCCKGALGDIINFIFLPFRTKQSLGCTSNNAATQRLSDILQYEVNGITNSGLKILVGHFMLQETILGNAVVDNHPGEIVLPPDMFQSLDAVVMGHIHPHQIIRRDPLITYIGSMERKDFGEVNHNKYFLTIEKSGIDTIFRFEKLPTRLLYDITFDQSFVNDEIMNNIKNYLTDYASKNQMFGSIVRVNIFVNEKTAQDIIHNEIISFLKKELLIYHCTGIHLQITAKRQLRKASITERLDPVSSFNEYLELEEDPTIRERMRELGVNIISKRLS